MLLLLAAQYSLGLAVAVDVHLPPSHLVSSQASVVRGTAQNVLWAIAHGGPALGVHAALGLAIVVAGVALAGMAVVDRRISRVASTVGLTCTLGAAAGGARFLGSGGLSGSEWMGSCTFVAAAAYVLISLQGAPQGGAYRGR